MCQWHPVRRKWRLDCPANRTRRHCLGKPESIRHISGTEFFFKMKPTGCTLLLSIFISTPLHVSGDYLPIIGRICCVYAALVFFTRYGWLSGLQTKKLRKSGTDILMHYVRHFDVVFGTTHSRGDQQSIAARM